jgi:DNA gyrase subunit A
MTTNIPPHNLSEVIDGAICVLDNPEADLNDLMEHIQGPDFPTRGIIMGKSGIRAAYGTGRGRIVVRARTELEEWGSNRTRIIVTELPYQVNKARLVANIADQVHDKRLEGISGLRDESDREGMRIVIELKRDANPQVVLNRLFAQTSMQTNFSVIMLALVDNQRRPKVLTLREILDEYIAHQMDVLTRRTIHDKKKAEARAHLLEGLLIAQDNIDEVIHIIRSSYDNAKERLMERFGLDDVQAQAILDMQLKRLQGLEHDKLQAEYDELQKKIAYYESLLADREKMKGVLRDELAEIRDKYGDERRTQIEPVENEIDVEDLIEEEECVFTLSHKGYLKRTPVSAYRVQKRGGKGVNDMNVREEDYVDSLFTCSTHDYILFFTNMGRAYVKKGYQIPEAGRVAKGVNIVNFISISQGEKVKAMMHSRQFQEDEYLIFATKNGTVKRLASSELKNIRNNGIRALRLEEDNELIAVRRTTGHDEILMVTRLGQAIRFSEEDVRPMGRTAAGVRGIRLREGDEVIGCEIVGHGETLLTVTENGYGKRTDTEEYNAQSRGGFGMRNYKISDKTGPVSACAIVDEADDVLLISDDGTIIRTSAGGISVYGRSTQGVRVMNVAEGVKVNALAKTRVEDEELEDKESEGAEERTGEDEVTADFTEE